MLIWKKLSSNAHLQQRAKHVSPKGETTVYYLNEVAHYGRMAQYLDDLFMLIMQRPKFQDGEDRFFES